MQRCPFFARGTVSVLSVETFEMKNSLILSQVKPSQRAETVWGYYEVMLYGYLHYINKFLYKNVLKIVTFQPR
jgi:hypothetical protein